MELLERSVLAGGIIMKLEKHMWNMESIIWKFRTIVDITLKLNQKTWLKDYILPLIIRLT